MPPAYNIGIIVFDGVLTSEVLGPAEVFALAGQRPWFQGARVLLIGVEPQPTIRTEEGLRLTVDATLADDLTLEVLLVPGGNDMSPLLKNARLEAYIRRHADTAEWLGSVCAGAFLLGNAGVLDGQQATTWFGGEAQLRAEFPAIKVVHDQPVVLDKRRLTANGGLVSYQAALVLLGQLRGPERAKEIYDSLGLPRLERWAQIEATIVQGRERQTDLAQTPSEARSAARSTVIRSADLPPTPGGTVRFEGEPYGSEVSFFHVNAEPGRGADLHQHPYPETWLVRAGKARFTVGGDALTAGPGDVVVAGPAIPHKFTNIGAERLELICLHPSPRIIQEAIAE